MGYARSLLTTECLHLYINGHILFDLVKDILSTLNKKHYQLNVAKIKESFPVQQIQNKTKEIQSKQLDIETALKLNFSNCYYEQNSSIHRIIEDVKECYKE